MEKTIAVLEIIVPIFCSILLGVYARRKAILTPEQAAGLQQFVLRILLPIMMFNSCLFGDFGRETLLSMALLLPLLLIGTLCAFRLRGRVGYSNLPMAFAAGEAGMLGVPLYLTLFGQTHAYRFVALQIAQLLTVVPVIAILSAGDTEKLSASHLVKRVFRTPLLLGSLLGLVMNLTGAMAWLNDIGVGGILTETTTFLAASGGPVILFAIGYTFSLTREGRRDVYRVCTVQYAVFSLFCLIMQGVLFLLPDVEPETRWAVLLYCMLPAPFMMPPLGKDQRERAFAAGLCSLGTVIILAVFCVITVATR